MLGICCVFGRSEGRRTRPEIRETIVKKNIKVYLEQAVGRRM